jgi:hypothetical protein
MDHHRKKQIVKVALSSDVEYQPTSLITSTDNQNTNDNHMQETSYIFRTIRNDNRNRLSILPVFPTTTNEHEYHLLLANVPSLFI